MKPSLIPIPQKVKYLSGASKIDNNTPVNYIENPEIKHEGYNLLINDNKIEITYSDEAGKFYALQTLKQIKATCGGTCDNLEIEDYPRFSHRGFMLDCARHFFPLDDIKKVIDSAAFLKLNVFHWHITDDQGWRLPVKKHPLLTEIGGKRKNSIFGGHDEKSEYAAAFTEEDIKEIVDYCKERFINVIPEIDMPGHTTSILAVYPNLGCTGEKVEVGMKEGVYDTVLCLGNPDSISLVHDILDTVCELFPGKYVHIGGDEAPRKKWSKCPKCQEKLKSLGTDDINKLQDYFIKDVADYLKTKGKIAITWNESLKGNVLGKDDVIVQRWDDKQNLSIAFAEKGGKVIEADFFHYYCDYPYGMTPVKKTYDYDPACNCKNPLGVEAELWTEYVRSFDDICEKFYPRISAMAESAWTSESNKNYNSFVSRHEALRKSFEEMGIKIVPVSDWSLSPIKRVKNIFDFFKGSVNFKTLKDAYNNQIK